jgi:hypothetical protein
VARVGSFGSRAEYAIWAAQAGERTIATRPHAEIGRAKRR